MPTMTRRHARRLLKLANKLETVPRKKFDMGQWWGPVRDAQENVCGTAGCALGWATTVPSFRAAGLSLKVNKFGGVGCVEFSPRQPCDLVTQDQVSDEHFLSHG